MKQIRYANDASLLERCSARTRIMNYLRVCLGLALLGVWSLQIPISLAENEMDDDALTNIIQDELVEVYVLYVGGVPGGLGELDRRTEGQIELCTKVCTIATVLHQVHPGEDRGAHRKILNTHHV